MSALLESIDDRTCPPAELRQHLEEVVLSPERMATHFAWLASRKGPFPDRYTECEAEDMASRGLGHLGEAQLRQLAFDPEALARLRNLVLAGRPAPWLDVLTRLAEGAGAGAAPGEHAARPAPAKVPRPADEAVALKGPTAYLPPPGLGPPANLTDQQVYNAFNQRVLAESDAIALFPELPPRRREETLARLEALLARARAEGGDAFFALDVEFHVTLGEAGGLGPGFVREACRFIYEHGDREALSPARQREVCAEHQALVDALRASDYERAAAASRRHLFASRERWLPGVHQALVRRNLPYFDRMVGPGRSLLCVGSLNVTPVEMDGRRPYAPVGQAAARAVGRGATLLYLRPSQPLLDRWSRCGLKELLGREVEMRQAFANFRRAVVAELAGMGCYGPEAAVQAAVSERVFQLHVDHEPLFDFVRPNATVGYFRYGDGAEVMTHRDPLADTEAWPEIAAAAQTSLVKEHFLWRAGEAVRLAAEREPDGELRARAELLAYEWFPPAPGSPVASGGA